MNFQSAIYAPLSLDEERALHTPWPPPATAQRKLVLAHQRLLAYHVLRYREARQKEDVFEELMSAANLGLAEAIPRFEPERGFRFATFALDYALLHLRRAYGYLTDPVYSKTMSGQFGSLYEPFERAVHERGDELAAAEQVIRASPLARAVAPKTFLTIYRRTRERSSDRSLDAPWQPLRPEAGPWSERVVLTADSSVEEQVSTAEREEAIRTRFEAVLSGFSSRDRALLRLIWMHENGTLSYQAAAHRFGISRERARQIAQRALTKLAPVMRDLAEGGRTAA